MNAESPLCVVHALRETAQGVRKSDNEIYSNPLALSPAPFIILFQILPTFDLTTLQRCRSYLLSHH